MTVTLRAIETVNRKIKREHMHIVVKKTCKIGIILENFENNLKFANIKKKRNNYEDNEKKSRFHLSCREINSNKKILLVNSSTADINMWY